jgi:hypothetical protein
VGATLATISARRRLQIQAIKRGGVLSLVRFAIWEACKGRWRDLCAQVEALSYPDALRASWAAFSRSGLLSVARRFGRRATTGRPASAARGFQLAPDRCDEIRALAVELGRWPAAFAKQTNKLSLFCSVGLLLSCFVWLIMACRH